MTAGGAASTDDWAQRYITLKYVRNIMEAFDEDVSGFITIKEANDFTGSRPLDWRWVSGKHDLVQLADLGHSLPHWLAYWTTGDFHRSIDRGSSRLTMTRLADDLYKLLQEDRRDIRCHDQFVGRSPSREPERG